VGYAAAHNDDEFESEEVVAPEAGFARCGLTNRMWSTAAYQYGRNYNYDNADRLIWTDDPGFTSPTYDSHGNMRTAGTGSDYKDMSYDAANRHTGTSTPSGTVTYVRDATNRIVERKVNGTTVARLELTEPERCGGFAHRLSMRFLSDSLVRGSKEPSDR